MHHAISIVDPLKTPYSSIARVDAIFQCRCKGMYTGFLIGPSLVMTAARATACPVHGKPVSYLSLSFGYEGRGRYADEYDGRCYVTRGTDFIQPGGSPGYTAEDMHRDYAFIRTVEDRPGDEYGWFGMTAFDDTALRTTDLRMAGYRMENYHTEFIAYLSSADKASPHIFHYPCRYRDDFTGAPIFTSDRKVVGIQLSSDVTGGIALRVTRPLIEQAREKLALK